MRRVVVKIEALTLRGFRYEDRHAVAQGLQEGLARLLSEPGMAERLGKVGSIPHLPVGSIAAEADDKPRQVGIATANGIARGLDR